MEYKAHTQYSNAPYLRHLNYCHHHHLRLLLLLLLLLLAYFPSTMANWNNNLDINPGDSNTDMHVTYVYKPPPPADARDEGQTDKGEWFQCQCPSAFECPLTLAPEAYKQLKNNLGPVIRQRLTELLKKALTVESAIEAAQTIDLLKLLNESNTELNAVRESMENGAQQLRDAFLKLPEIM